MGFALPGDHYLTDEQIQLLLKPIHPQRVLALKGMSYVEGYDIRAELNRVFGFTRWSEEILEQFLVREAETKTNAGKPAWNVIYRTHVRLTIQAPDGSHLAVYHGSHVGESTHPVCGEAHGVALTASETYALRRAAINLGDQFGLSLYNKGSMEALVRWTLVRPEPSQETFKTDTDNVPAISAENPEPVEEVTPAITKRKAPAAKEVPVKTAQELADDAFTADAAEITAIGKRAGELGVLQDAVKNPETAEDIKLRDYLYRRLDSLSSAKSTAGAEGDPGTTAGAE